MQSAQTSTISTAYTKEPSSLLDELVVRQSANASIHKLTQKADSLQGNSKPPGRDLFPLNMHKHKNLTRCLPSIEDIEPQMGRVMIVHSIQSDFDGLTNRRPSEICVELCRISIVGRVSSADVLIVETAEPDSTAISAGS